MLISDYIKLRGQINVTTGTNIPEPVKKNEDGKTFADELHEKLLNKGGVEFSNHAIKRLESRNIDVDMNNGLARLNKGARLAAEKGSNDTLILIDQNAYIVNLKNNKVITTMSSNELKENIFTNIDSTVIM